MGTDQDCRLPRVSCLCGTAFPNHDCSSRRSPGASHWRAHVQNKASRSQQEPPDNCSHPRSPKFGPGRDHVPAHNVIPTACTLKWCYPADRDRRPSRCPTDATTTPGASSAGSSRAERDNESSLSEEVNRSVTPGRPRHLHLTSRGSGCDIQIHGFTLHGTPRRLTTR